MAGTRAASATKEAPTKAPKAPKYHPCACLTGTGEQCPEETSKVFGRGHDAKMSSRIAQAVATKQMTEAAGLKLIRDAGGSDLLVSKTKHSIALRAEKNSEAGKARAAAKAAKGQVDKAVGGKLADPGTTVVGKPTDVKHGDKTYKAVVVRTADGDLKARHRIKGQNCDHDVEV